MAYINENHVDKVEINTDYAVDNMLITAVFEKYFFYPQLIPIMLLVFLTG